LSKDAAGGQGKENSHADSQRRLHCALAHDQSDDVAAMCAQRDSDANLAGAAGDGVGFYP
jgi:hypothetical protein